MWIASSCFFCFFAFLRHAACTCIICLANTQAVAFFFSLSALGPLRKQIISYVRLVEKFFFRTYNKYSSCSSIPESKKWIFPTPIRIYLLPRISPLICFYYRSIHKCLRKTNGWLRRRSLQKNRVLIVSHTHTITYTRWYVGASATLCTTEKNPIDCQLSKTIIAVQQYITAAVSQYGT